MTPLLTARISRIEAACRMAIALGDKATEAPWNGRKAFSGLVSLRSNEVPGTNIASFDLDPITGTASGNCEFVSFTRTFTPLAAQSLLDVIEALKSMDYSALAEAALERIASRWPENEEER